MAQPSIGHVEIFAKAIQYVASMICHGAIAGTGMEICSFCRLQVDQEKERRTDIKRKTSRFWPVENETLCKSSSHEIRMLAN